MDLDSWRQAWRTAQTPTASTVHEPVGKPGGPGLWHHKGLQLPAYIQHVANDLRAQGHSESGAVEMAVGIVKNWAAGHDGHGHKVHPDVRAAAAENIAQWEALKARAGGAKRFNPHHAPAGTPAGGEFAASGGAGGGGGAKGGAKGKRPAAAPVSRPAAGGSSGGGGPANRKAALVAQAHADRQKAHRLERELHLVEAQIHLATGAAAKAHAAAKSAGHTVKHHTKTTTTHHKTTTHHTTPSAAQTLTALQTKAAGLRGRIRALLHQARALDRQAAAIRYCHWQTAAWQQAWHLTGSEAPGRG